jgi:hypothetical protein
MSSPLQKMLADRQALINDIVSYMEVLRNVYGITPEFIWNNLNPTHRIYVNDDSLDRCAEWKHCDPQNDMSISINEGKETKFINGCCDYCSGIFDDEEEKAKDIQFNQAYE